MLRWAVLLVLVGICNGECIWEEKDFARKNRPLLTIKDDRGIHTTILPKFPHYITRNSVIAIRMREDGVFYMSCPEQDKIAQTGLFQGIDTNTVEVKCFKGKLVDANEKEVDMKNVVCGKGVKEHVTETSMCGPNNYGKIKTIGFMVEKKLLELIRVCTNKTTKSTYYSSHTLRGGHSKFERSSRGKFRDIKPDHYYDSTNDTNNEPLFRGIFIDSEEERSVEIQDKLNYDNIFDAYRRRPQGFQLKLNDVLKSPNYIQTEGELYFARGHLAPDADFFTKMEAHATYHYINAAPQWQVFNNGNWKKLEAAIRKYALLEGKDLKIWTGTFGILTKNGKEVYLAQGKEHFEAKKPISDNHKFSKEIPAPEIFWKVVINVDKRKGVGFIGRNNGSMPISPWETKHLCTEITRCIMGFDNESKGQIKCCKIKDFTQKFNDVFGLNIPANDFDDLDLSAWSNFSPSGEPPNKIIKLEK